MPKLHRMNPEMLAFHCPGCKHAHAVFVSGTGHPSWTWNGSMDAPTFAPSIMTYDGHYDPLRKGGECWCTYNQTHPNDPVPYKCSRCHSFVRDGKIEFLADCSHALAGKIVELPEWD